MLIDTWACPAPARARSRAHSSREATSGSAGTNRQGPPVRDSPPGNRWTPRVGPDAHRSRQYIRHAQGPYAPVIQAAHRRGLSIRCVRLSTTLEDAQVNAAGRIAAKYGRPLGREEMRQLAKHRRRTVSGRRCNSAISVSWSPRIPSEGFSDIYIVPFERRPSALSIPER